MTDRVEPVGWTCPVCGYAGLGEDPWPSGGGGSHEICSCCGTHLGYEDAAPDPADRARRHAELREAWVADGCPWWARGVDPPPVGWDPDAQLRRIEPGAGTA